MSKIFFGYLLVFFHLKFNGFDILMDFVGFFLIYRGLCSFENAPHFHRAKPWALALGAVSLVSAFGGLFRLFSFAPLGAFAGIFTTGMSLYLLWLIGGGVGELEAVHEHPLGADTLRRIWKVQAGAGIGTELLVHFPAKLAVMLSAVAALVWIAANIFFLVYIYKAKKTLEARTE